MIPSRLAGPVKSLVTRGPGRVSTRAFGSPPRLRSVSTSWRSLVRAQYRERDYELEPAKAEVARLSEALKEMAVKLMLIVKKGVWD